MNRADPVVHLTRSRRLTRFLRDDQGQAATEYVLIVGLIVLPLVLVFNKFTGVLKSVVDRIAKLLYGPGV